MDDEEEDEQLKEAAHEAATEVAHEAANEAAHEVAEEGGDRWEAPRKVAPIPAIDRRGETRFRISVRTASLRPLGQATKPAGGYDEAYKAVMLSAWTALEG